MEKQILIVGYGEVGKSIHKLYTYKEGYDIHYIDVKKEAQKIPDKIDIIHICIPNIPTFEDVVCDYWYAFKPELIIIHSTVIIGTTRKIKEECGNKANIVHSPVMGVHPHLTESIQTFTKILGSCKKKESIKASKHFEDIGVKCLIYKTPEDSEAAKLLSTTYYGWNIMFNKFIHRFCEENDLNFDEVYTTTNEIYNDGFEKMGMRHVNRPILKYVDGKIGGHCILSNMKILKNIFFPANLMLEWT